MAQNYTDFMSCVRSLLAEQRPPQKTSQNSAANKVITNQSNEAVISVTPDSSATNKSILPQLTTVVNNEAIVPMTLQSSAANKATPPQLKRVENNAALISMMTQINAAVKKAIPTQTAMTQSNAANTTMTPRSPAANRAIPTQTAMTQSNAANISMTPQSPAANRATPIQTAMTQSNTANISMTPQSPAANRATPTQTAMTQSNAANISMTPQSLPANKAIPSILTNVEFHAANVSVLSDADLLAYTTAATVEILRRYVITPLSSAANKAIPHQPATSQSNISTSSEPSITPQNSGPMSVDSHTANLSTVSNTQLSACFYVAAIKVLHRSKKALMGAAKEANPPQPTTTLSNTPLSGPEMLGWFVKADINVLLQLAMRLRTKFDIAIPSSIVQSNLPIAELLAFATAVTVEILERKAKDQNGVANLSTSPSASTTSQSTATVHSNLTYISILSGPELLAFITAASVEVFQRNVKVLGNKLLLPPPKLALSNVDDVLTVFRPEILTCFSENTKTFLQKSLKDCTASRKRSGETNNGKVKTRRLSQSSASTDPHPPPQLENQLSTKSYPPVYEVLTCSICDIWMTQDQIKMCACKVICTSCASPLTKCEDCHITFKSDIRLVNFHQRIAKQIVRPCKYTRDGCTYVVKPGDKHEASCEYEPVACDKCNEYVSKALMGDHFEAVHFLGTENLDVKFADFYLDAAGSRKIKCVTNQGLNLHISFMDADSVDQFTVVYPITDSNFRVRFHFDKDGYMYSRTDFKPLISTPGKKPTTITFIDKNIFRDWVNGENKLTIQVDDLKRPKGSLMHLHKRYMKKMENKTAYLNKNASNR